MMTMAIAGKTTERATGIIGQREGLENTPVVTFGAVRLGFGEMMNVLRGVVKHIEPLRNSECSVVLKKSLPSWSVMLGALVAAKISHRNRSKILCGDGGVIFVTHDSCARLCLSDCGKDEESVTEAKTYVIGGQAKCTTYEAAEALVESLKDIGMDARIRKS